MEMKLLLGTREINGLVVDEGGSREMKRATAIFPAQQNSHLPAKFQSNNHA
jgi:hypothetical protein